MMVASEEVAEEDDVKTGRAVATGYLEGIETAFLIRFQEGSVRNSTEKGEEHQGSGGDSKGGVLGRETQTGGNHLKRRTPNTLLRIKVTNPEWVRLGDNHAGNITLCFVVVARGMTQHSSPNFRDTRCVLGRFLRFFRCRAAIQSPQLGKAKIRMMLRSLPEDEPRERRKGMIWEEDARAAGR